MSDAEAEDEHTDLQPKKDSVFDLILETVSFGGSIYIFVQN